MTKIAIVGVGAVGGYFGGRLTQTAHEVSFIARGAHLDAIREHGLQIQSENGNFTAHPTIATDDPAEIGMVDVVIVATKAWQISNVTQGMQALVGDHTVIVPLLNGVEAPHQLAEIYGFERVLGGFCRVQSNRDAPGHIIQGGTPPFVAIGAIHDTSRERENVQKVSQLFTEAGITVNLPDSIEAAMWQKLLFISAFGGVGAVTRMPAGRIRTEAETRAMVETAMLETCAVALARGVPMAEDAVQRGMTMLDSLPEASTASMQRDIMNGYPSELDAQNGAVVRLGAEVNVPTPTHQFIYYSLLPQERQARDG
ncbi:MAG: 2-dehydropantoate 2-reductase [Aggregatilineales bacterium]